MSVHQACFPFTSSQVLFVRHWQPRPPHERHTRLLQSVRARMRRVQSGHAWLSFPNLQKSQSLCRTTDTLPRHSANDKNFS